jgi:UDP-N-acetylglucosamine acyltransferase
VHVEQGANIGGGVGVHHFVTIGRHSFVGGLARVSKDVPPFMTVAGFPATVRSVNAIALARSGAPPEQVEALREAHRRLFRDAEHAAMSEKIDALRRDFAGVDVVTVLCDALARTGEGLHGRALETSRIDNKREAPARAQLVGESQRRRNEDAE